MLEKAWIHLGEFFVRVSAGDIKFTGSGREKEMDDMSNRAEVLRSGWCQGSGCAGGGRGDRGLNAYLAIIPEIARAEF